MPIAIGNATKTSANAYANVFTAAILTKPYMYGRFAVQVVENNVNAVTFKVRASIDGVTYSDLDLDGDGSADEVALSKNASACYIIEEPWIYLNVQVKSTVEGSHGSLTVFVSQG